MRPAIRVDGLSKQYRLGASKLSPNGQLREIISDGVKGLVRRLWGRGPQRDGERKAGGDGAFWALKDVSFEVQPGEVVGILGRNGAGKSTLLKILSQIVEPTSGRAEVRGRMGSLLEVGTGFHHELTGRENIYLNGSILGMRRAEINRKFDEIVAFSEIEQFLDTPVKRYSSGMYVRLAFAVAAHLEPEILVVDEVLAVGDSQFQKKCLGKMGNVAAAGRTVLFVSHSMPAIQHLCQSAVILDKGRIIERGSATEMVSKYLRRQSKAGEVALQNFENRTGNRQILFTSFHLEDEKGRRVSVVQSGQSVTLVLGYRCPDGAVKKTVNVGFGLHSTTNDRLIILYASHTGQEFDGVPERGEFRCRVTRLPLNPGRFYLFPRIEINGVEADFPRDGVGYIDVEAGDFYGTGRQTVDQSYAPFLIQGDWVHRAPGPADA
jgi:lipopolysaccharide transport system ATP-binding protein